MERVENDLSWTLMCPSECPGLTECFGEAFEKLYSHYEGSGYGRRTIKARELWRLILQTQLETGGPAVLYKDAVNSKSNLSNVGCVRASSLNGDLMLTTSEGETAACAQALIYLPSFVSEDNNFDFDQLHDVVQILTRSLDKSIDGLDHSLSMAHQCRPLGIGIDGFTDTCLTLGYSFDSPETKELNILIAETVYHGALRASCQLAQEVTSPYPAYAGSPISLGQFQFDMCGVTPTERWDWKSLKFSISKYGIRNALLVASPISIPSTADLEAGMSGPHPPISYVNQRETSAGRFYVFNHSLVRDLINHGQWTADIRQQIIEAHGSVQKMDTLSPQMRDKYRTASEVKQKSFIELAIDRAPFVDQSQTMNLHFEEPKADIFNSMHFFGWRSGLKTGFSNNSSAASKDSNRWLEESGLILQAISMLLIDSVPAITSGN